MYRKDCVLYKIPSNVKKTTLLLLKLLYALPLSSKRELDPTDVPNQHFVHLGHYIVDKFQQEKLRDMAFKIGHKIIPVHQLVQGSKSSFFNNMIEEEVFSQ